MKEIDGHLYRTASSEPLNNPLAESDAQAIAEVWATEGREAAVVKFNEIAGARKMKRYETVIMLDRITTILCASGQVIR